MIHHLRTTPSAHPTKGPPQCPSLTSHPHQPSVCSLYLRVSYGLPPSLLDTIFPPFLLPWSSVQFLKIHMSENTWHLSFSNGFHLALYPPVRPCCCKWKDFILFHCHVVFHCIYKPHLLYPFISWWTFGLFPWFGYCWKHS